MSSAAPAKPAPLKPASTPVTSAMAQEVEKGRGPGVRVAKNWEERFSFLGAKEYYQPSTLEEVVKIVVNARKQGKKVKVVGAGHSWMDINLPQDIQVSLDKYGKIISIDKEKLEVRVQAGIRLRHLQDALVKEGLSLKNMGSVAAQSIAGAASTGTHGTGLGYGNLATQIKSFQIVTGTGLVIEASAEQNADVYAARVNLGALGIITEVTLSVRPLGFIKEEAKTIPFQQWTSDKTKFKELIYDEKTNKQVKIWHLPAVKESCFFTFTPTEQTTPILKSDIISYVETKAFEYGQWVMAKIPSLTPPLITMYRSLGLLKDDVRVGRTDLIWNLQHPVAVHPEMEYAISVEDTVDAMLDVQAFIDKEKLHVNHIIEIRFVKADDIWLSNNYQRDSCHITLLTHSWDSQRNRKFFLGFEQIMKKYHGRPHWGKWFLITQNEVKALYPCWEKFATLRAKLDPDGIFLNDFLRRVFLPEHANTSGPISKL